MQLASTSKEPFCAFSQAWAKQYYSRLDWAYEAHKAFTRTLQDPHVRALYERATSKEHVNVAVYGRTQVGKSTLILRLLGLDEEHFEAVSDALRGGRSTGRSATATAVLYEVIKGDRFSYREPGSEPIYATLEDLASTLQKLRRRVERGHYRDLEAVRIGVPEQYVDRGAGNQLEVTIIDLPGTHSDNPGEQQHVARLVRHYLPAAHLVLLVERAEKMESLSGFHMPDGYAWQDFPNRHRIVLTYSVSSWSVQEQLKNMDQEVREAIEEEAQADGITARTYRALFEKPLAAINVGGVAVYPLEYGDSWRALAESKPDLYKQMEQVQRDLLDELVRDINRSSSPSGQIRQYMRMQPLLHKVRSHVVSAYERECVESQARCEELIADEKLYVSHLEALDAEIGPLREKREQIDKWHTRAQRIPSKHPTPPKLKSGEWKVHKLQAFLRGARAGLLKDVTALQDELEARSQGLAPELRVELPDLAPSRFRSSLKVIDQRIAALDSYTWDFYDFGDNYRNDLKKTNRAARKAADAVQAMLQREKSAWLAALLAKYDTYLESKVALHRNAASQLARTRRELAEEQKHQAARAAQHRERMTVLESDIEQADRYVSFQAESFRRKWNETVAGISASGETPTRQLTGLLMLAQLAKTRKRVQV